MPPHPAPATPRRILAVTVLAAGLALAGCTADAQPAPTPEPTTPVASVVPEPESTPTPTAPALMPDGTAADNLPIFTSVTQQVWASPQQAEGRAYVDALVQTGFDKQAMQVTEDMSTVGNPAESIQFSVLWAGECLIGQVGPATGEPVTIVAAELPDGGCLLGDTRRIDW